MIEFEIGKDKDGNIIHINKAIKGEEYYCLDSKCGSQFIVKKGNIRAHHFAHKSSNLNHSGESILHYNTKWLIYKLLNENKVKLVFEGCGCGYTHYLDISGWYDSVGCEKSFFNNRYRPDISLVKNNKLIASIEIIHKHNLEPEKKILLSENKIPCFKFIVDEDKYRILLKRKIYNGYVHLFQVYIDTLLNFDFYKTHKEKKLYNYESVNILDNIEMMREENRKWREEKERNCQLIRRQKSLKRQRKKERFIKQQKSLKRQKEKEKLNEENLKIWQKTRRKFWLGNVEKGVEPPSMMTKEQIEELDKLRVNLKMT